ncbi:sugar ABC transporter permease [Muricomes sp. OA1]|uniref:Sugar ABC transporter permease n=1 Tax=Hungatella hathewayi TaxID=154046 RepID=A0A3E2WXQ6_9FIRM|nr:MULTISPECIES: sugar ABC transporter permease [Clostridia]MCH1974526.1 sugar ABC transporter permease [Muricomes sp. OA1]RGC32960.1 sugar ABC transporter permease [Hungatella hathewayi]GKH33306.1 sugar ABC transporter permease [Faecalicatena contorta]
MNKKKIYSLWFLVPALTIFLVFFIIPMVISLFFSLTVWDFEKFTFVGLDNFKMFFSERTLNIGIINTLIYAVLTSGLKVVLAFLIAVFLTSAIRTKNIIRLMVFFPNLVSTIAVGITFTAFMHPTKGVFNKFIEFLGGTGIDWLGNADLALYSVIGTDVWKGLSIATMIYIAGISSIDKTYYEAAAIDGANGWQKIRLITLPLCRPAMNSVIILSFIGGLRCFDLIWTMTGGGPGFSTDVMASIVYKQYASGFYGLSTAGNVIMFILIAILAFPLQRFLQRREVE